MPKLARWYIKSALVYLVLGALIAALALSGAAVRLPPGLLALRPLAWHMLTLGWATQLIFGVAFWMFPHLSKEQPRGDERWSWAAFWTLNVGLALRAIGEPALALWPGVLPPVVLQSAAVLQVAAVYIFAATMWSRVRSLAHQS
jgi:hypothetical protein